MDEVFGTLWELFHHKVFEIWSRTSRSLQTPVLILDQFEEYIIGGVDTAIGAARKECERTEANERRRLEEQRLLQEKLAQEEARRIEQEKLHAKQLQE